MAQITIREDINGPVPDSRMASNNPTTKYGAGTTMNVGFTTGFPDAINRSILNFPISAVPDGVNLTAATLRLYCSVAAASDEASKVRRITRSDWVEAEVTWDDYKAATAWTSGGGDYSTTDEADFSLPTGTGDQDIDILSLVRDALYERSSELHIVVMRATESGASAVATYRAGEHATAGDRPELIIDYEYSDRLEPMNKLRSRIPMARRRTPIVGTVL